MLDVAIIGAGPAGATAARLLAQWGYSVAIFTAPTSKRPSLAECLPPSTRKVFEFLGIQGAVDRAGFFRTSGNTVWWGKRGRRVESYPDGLGYQVVRSDFDRLLLDLSGVRVEMGKPIRARFTIDCSGRAGVLARAYRVPEKNARTVALCGVWHNSRGWKLPDASHTLVEAYADGWAWSVPVSPEIRYVAFMVGPGETKMVRGKGITAAYQAELCKTRAFCKIFASSELTRAPWGADASQYSSRQYSGPGFLLAGDAASFIDPLSSFGVKKAMVSAWVAAVVVNTCFEHPAMQEAALKFYDDREREVYASYRARTAHIVARVLPSRDREGVHQTSPFWQTRSEPTIATLEDHSATRAAFTKLKRQRSLRLSLSTNIKIDQRPRIEGREIVLKPALILPDVTLDFLDNIDLVRLATAATKNQQIPEMFEAYNRSGIPATLPNFLTALSSLVARGILVDETHPR